MTKVFSNLIVWGCRMFLVAAPMAAFYFITEPEQLRSVVETSFEFRIQWGTVTQTQLTGMWLLSLVYMLPGLIGVYFLQRAFARFARGATFELATSCDLRRFAMLLFVQALARPIYLALSSVWLSWNHPAGERILSLMIGSEEFQALALAMILWVICDLLVKANRLDHENKQFV